MRPSIPPSVSFNGFRSPAFVIIDIPCMLVIVLWRFLISKSLERWVIKCLGRTVCYKIWRDYRRRVNRMMCLYSSAFIESVLNAYERETCKLESINLLLWTYVYQRPHSQIACCSYWRGSKWNGYECCECTCCNVQSWLVRLVLTCIVWRGANQQALAEYQIFDVINACATLLYDTGLHVSKQLSFEKIIRSSSDDRSAYCSRLIANTEICSSGIVRLLYVKE